MAEGMSTGVEARRGRKSAAAFRTISEVAGELDVPQHVLRFWETKFAHIKPLKRGGGRRYYRPEDISLLWRIKTLLYDDGYTIKGVQKLLREGVIKSAPDRGELVLERSVTPKVRKADLAPKARAEVEAVLGELIAVREMMRRGS